MFNFYLNLYILRHIQKLNSKEWLPKHFHTVLYDVIKQKILGTPEAQSYCNVKKKTFIRIANYCMILLAKENTASKELGSVNLLNIHLKFLFTSKLAKKPYYLFMYKVNPTLHTFYI